MFTLNFDVQKVFRGHASGAIIAIAEDRRAIMHPEYSLSGNTSKDTYMLGNRAIIAADEKAEKLTVTVTYEGESVSCTLALLDATGKKTEFDDNNVILTFGVTSDTHISGSWNQQRSPQKWVHFIDIMQKIAGKNADGTSKLDAITCAGDFVDAVNSFGNVNRSVESHGLKGAQNYREVSYLRSGLEGRATNRADSTDGGKALYESSYGNGLSDGIGFFYCLGNHDERGCGESAENESFTKVYTARYFVAVMCGWEYSPENGKDTPDGYDGTYVKYAEDLVAIHKACPCKKDEMIKAFTKEHCVDGEYAYGRFKAYYGNDTEYSTEERGLFYGNRHTVMNGIHFIAIEVSQSEESARYLDKWCAASVAEDERKPIIVYTHEKIYHTVDSSVPRHNELDAHASRPGHAKLLTVLAKYPQAIVWTGHTHSVLTNENSIMSDCGFTSVEASVLAYLSCEGLIHRGEIPSGNFCRKEEHNIGPCCLVKIDKNYNVKIEKIDAHRSYNSEAGFPDSAVYYGEPWIITDISSSGEHLIKYSIERSFDENNPAPYFPDGAKVTLTKGEDGKLYASFPAARKGNGSTVKYYKVILENKNDSEDKPHQYVTSFTFFFSDEKELLEKYPTYSISFPAEKEPRVSENLQHCVDLSTPREGAEYKAYVTAYDSWHRASETLVSE